MMVVATRKRKVSRSEPWDFFDISEMSVPESTANIEWIEICINREIALKVWVPKTLIVGGVQKFAIYGRRRNG